jgi:CubicO group peptidase (beta-lactamase class C family)
VNTPPSLSPSPCRGSYADGFAPLAERFAAQVRKGSEIGAALTVYHRGSCVVDLWGGQSDVERATQWERDTRIVVFSATKGLAAMALALLADRGQLDWDTPVANYWPGFATAGKHAISVRTLVNHRAGLVGIDQPLVMDDCLLPERHDDFVRVLEQQRPAWEPGTTQGYHAVTFGMYVGELFERIAGESMGMFLQRELLDPLGADVSLGTPPAFDPRIATLYPPSTSARVFHMLAAAMRPGNTEGLIVRASFGRDAFPRKAFSTPRLGPAGIVEYNVPPVRRAELAWASATASAHGLARAYLPFASGGSFEGRTYLRSSTLSPVYERQGWSERDLVLHKPIGWSQGFLKEETQLFSPNRESFGHSGLGGALGWCDPVNEIAFGYVMNHLDWRVRSPRALALCHALYSCAPVRSAKAVR